MGNQKVDGRAKKKDVRHVVSAVAHISATFNNTIVTITDEKGAVIATGSAGTVGFKGTKKSTPHAAQMVVENIVKKILEFGVKTIKVEIKGPGSGRETAVRALLSAGVEITSIVDKTPLPHNGCRPPKARRN
jgi:small subunit ribosomal protein S11